MAGRVLSAGIYLDIFSISPSYNFNWPARCAVDARAVVVVRPGVWQGPCATEAHIFEPSGLTRGEHYEQAYHTHFDINGAALFGGRAYHGGPGDWAGAE